MARNPNLSDETINTIASRAWFVFTLDWGNKITPYRGESNVTGGEGVSQFDEILKIFRDYPEVRVQLDAGTRYSNNVDVGPEDVQIIKDRYIALYGNTDRPSVYGATPDY